MADLAKDRDEAAALMWSMVTGGAGTGTTLGYFTAKPEHRLASTIIGGVIGAIFFALLTKSYAEREAKTQKTTQLGRVPRQSNPVRWMR